MNNTRSPYQYQYNKLAQSRYKTGIAHEQAINPKYAAPSYSDGEKQRGYNFAENWANRHGVQHDQVQQALGLLA